MIMFGILSKNLLNCSRLYVRSIFSTCTKSKFQEACGKWNSKSLAYKSTRQIIPKRHFFGVFKRPKMDQLKIIDKIPEEYKLIYRNSMERYILLVQIITTVCTLILVVIIFNKDDLKNYKSIYPEEEDKPQSTENENYYYIAAFVTFVVILQMIVYKLPMRIYYLSQQKKYIFIFYGSYPSTRRRLTCYIGEVEKLPDKGSFLWWKEMKYQIKDQQDIILTENSFRRPADLYIMLGIQRDPDHDIPE